MWMWRYRTYGSTCLKRCASLSDCGLTLTTFEDMISKSLRVEQNHFDIFVLSSHRIQSNRKYQYKLEFSFVLFPLSNKWRVSLNILQTKIHSEWQSKLTRKNIITQYCSWRGRFENSCENFDTLDQKIDKKHLMCFIDSNDGYRISSQMR